MSKKALRFDVGVGTTLVRAGNQGYKGAILTAGSASATLTVYDNGQGVASGDIKDELKAPAEANEGWIRDETEVVILNGVTVVVTGTGAKAKIDLSLDKI